MRLGVYSRVNSGELVRPNSRRLGCREVKCRLFHAMGVVVGADEGER
jgi:hypothetical protein